MRSLPVRLQVVSLVAPHHTAAIPLLALAASVEIVIRHGTRGRTSGLRRLHDDLRPLVRVIYVALVVAVVGLVAQHVLAGAPRELSTTHEGLHHRILAVACTSGPLDVWTGRSASTVESPIHPALALPGIVDHLSL